MSRSLFSRSDRHLSDSVQTHSRDGIRIVWWSESRVGRGSGPDAPPRPFSESGL